KLVGPSAHGLPTDVQPASHFRLIQIILLQQTDGLHAPLLQRLEIAFHAGRIAHAGLDARSHWKVSLYFANLNNGDPAHSALRLRPLRARTAVPSSTKHVMMRGWLSALSSR